MEKEISLSTKTKFLVFLSFSIILSFINNIFFIFLLYIYLIYVFIKLRKFPNIKIILFGDIFILFMIIFMPLFSNKKPFLNILDIKISIPTLKYSFLIFLKVTFLLSLLNVFFNRENIKNFICTLRDFFIPKEIVGVIFLSLRYLDEFYILLKNLETSAYLRGFKFKTSLRTYKIISYFIYTLIKNIYEKSKNITTSMRLRCYKGEIYIICEREKINVKFLFFTFTYLLLSFFLTYFISNKF